MKKTYFKYITKSFSSHPFAIASVGPCSSLPLFFFIFNFFFCFIYLFIHLFIYLFIFIFCASLSSIIFIISYTNYPIFHCFNYTSLLLHYKTHCITSFSFIYCFHYSYTNYWHLLLHLFITHLVIDFIITM